MRAIFAPLLLLIPLQATAQEPPHVSKGEIGVRTGFGIPLGKLADGGPDPDSNADMNDVVSGQIPIWLEAAYRITPNLTLGGFFQYGFMFVKDEACGGESNGNDITTGCSGHMFRIGPQLHYHLSPGQKVDPWIGISAGYESLTFTASALGFSFSFDATGWEFANLQAGADILVAPRFSIGPFASFSVDEITDVPGNDDFDKALHYWLMIGARGTFAL